MIGHHICWSYFSTFV